MGILDDAIREHLELKRRRGATDDELERQESEALGPARRASAGTAYADEQEAEPAIDAGPPPPDPDAAVGAGEGAPPPPSPPEAIEPFEPDDPDPLPPPPVASSPGALDDLDEAEDVDPLGMGDEEVFPPTEAMPVPFGDPEPPAAIEPELEAEPEPEPVLPPDEPSAADEAADLDPPLLEDDAATRVRPLPPMDDEGLPPAPALPPEHDEEPDTLEEIEPPPAAPAAGSDDVLEETPDFLQDTPEHDRLWFEQKPPRDFDFDD